MMNANEMEQLLYFGHAANDFEALQKFRRCFMVKHFLCMVTGGWRGPESRFFQAFFFDFQVFKVPFSRLNFFKSPLRKNHQFWSKSKIIDFSLRFMIFPTEKNG